MNKTVNGLKTILRPVYKAAQTKYWSYRAKDLGKLPPSQENTILFLLPEAGINLYSQNFAMIASQLRSLGHTVLFARCFNIFARCVFMDSLDVGVNINSADKNDLCAMCYKSFQQHIIKQKFNYIDLRHFANDHDLDDVKNVISHQPESTFDYKIEGVDFSGLIEYNLFLFLKKGKIADLNKEEVQLWQQNLLGLISAYKAIERLINHQNISHIIMQDEYSFTLAIRELAKKNNIHFKSVIMPFHKDVDISRVRIIGKGTLLEDFEALNQWQYFKPLPLSSERIKDIADDLFVRMSQKGVYSYSPNKTNNQDIIEKYGLCQGKKLIVAFPSSPDEVDSLINIHQKRGVPLPQSEDAFQNQFEWLKETIEFVERSHDLQMFVRMHPRMAPNHRENKGCRELDDFVEHFSKSYKNVRIIWSHEKVSSYDLIEMADLVTVSWSSLGLFASRLGVPVLTGHRRTLPIPNDTFYVHCKDKVAYFSQIGILVDKIPDFHDLQFAFRCYDLMYLIYTVQLNDIYKHNSFDLKRQSQNAEMLAKYLIHGASPLEYGLKKLQSEQIKNANDERVALQRYIYRMIHFFMTNEDVCINNLEIKQIPNPRFGNHNSDDNGVIILGENEVSYFYRGRNFVKKSPIVRRMVVLLNTMSDTYKHKTIATMDDNIS